MKRKKDAVLQQSTAEIYGMVLTKKRSEAAWKNPFWSY